MDPKVKELEIELVGVLVEALINSSELNGYFQIVGVPMQYKIISPMGELLLMGSNSRKGLSYTTISQFQLFVNSHCGKDNFLTTSRVFG